MAPASIRYRSDRYSDHLVRVVERNGRSVELRIQQRGEEWGELLDVSNQSVWLPCPGARRVTIAEYVGPAAKRVRRLGEWVEIAADVARSHSILLSWCRHHANSELPSGAFRLAPRDWLARSSDELDVPFLPEFDHPEDAIRSLAAVEATRRQLELRLQRACDLRREAIAAATSAGHSRRSLARLIGLSYARIQQLVRNG